jgi:peptidyl-prolyl cis-trans isomerase C
MATVYQARDAAAPFRAAQRAKVKVGGKTILSSDIAREMQNHEADSPLASWRAAARALAVRELLLHEARRLELVPDPLSDGDGRHETDDEALIRAVVEQAVATPEPDEATCRRYWERNAARFRSAELFEVSHILLPAAPGDDTARARARSLAAGLIETLGARADLFAQAAAEHSACPSARAGGSLGQLKRGDTVPEFDEAMSRLPVGVVAPEPVETRYGLHVVRVDRYIAGEALPFELVHRRIADYLAERSRRRATAQYLALLAARIGVEGVELPTPGDMGAM